MKNKIKWEEISIYSGQLERILVPGGWLVRTSDDGEHFAICFFSDHKHEWLKDDSR